MLHFYIITFITSILNHKRIDLAPIHPIIGRLLLYKNSCDICAIQLSSDRLILAFLASSLLTPLKAIIPTIRC